MRYSGLREGGGGDGAWLSLTHIWISAVGIF